MIIKKKISLFHIVFFLILVSGFLWPRIYYWSFLAFNLFYFFSSYKLKNIAPGDKKFFYFVLPWLFINGLFLYLSLLVFKFLVLICLLIGIYLSYFYFRELKRRLNRESNLVAGNFFAWADILGLFSVFLVSSFAYGLTHFLNISNWVLLLIIILVLFFSIWQNILTIESNPNKVLFFSFIFLFALTPLAWSLFFLPFNHNVFGVLLVIFYYFGLSFIKFYLRKSLTNKKIKYNLIFIITILTIIFLTVKWR